MLHVAEEVDIDGPVHCFRKRTDGSCEVAEAGATAFNSGKPITEDCWPGEQARSETASR